MIRSDDRPIASPKRRPDLDTGISAVALIVGIGLLVLTLRDQQTQVNIAAGDAPADLPLILLTLWITLSAFILIRSLVPSGRDRFEKIGMARQAPVIVTLAATILGMLAFGYLIPVSVGLAVLLFLLRERRPLIFAAAWLVLGPGLWFLLHHVLQIRLPSFLSGGLL
jgi:hypothetical protein